jgi:hypothetical protein
MLERLHAQYHEIRLALRGAWLRGQERAALRRLGHEVTRTEAIPRSSVRPLVDQVLGVLARVEHLRAQRVASLAADRSDMAVAPGWVRPAVVLRGLCTRLILRQRGAAEMRGLEPLYESIGRLTPDRGELPGQHSREVEQIRAELAAREAERARWGAPYGGSALPAWGARVGGEAVGFGRAVGRQLRSSLLPKAPALAGLAAGWWVADTFTDSHLRATFRSLGFGSGGTRVVSASTYDAMRFWLPLLAAALCAYLGDRVAAHYADGGRMAGAAPGGGLTPTAGDPN